MQYLNIFKMLKRKEQVGKRQFYRRIRHEVLSICNEISMCSNNAKQSQNVLSTRKASSCFDNFNINSQDVKDDTKFALHEANDNIPSLYLNNVLDDDSYTANGVLDISKECSDFHNFQFAANNSELESTHVYDLKAVLAEWSTKFKISHTAINSLLHILVPLHPELPVNAKTLLKTPKSIVVKQLDNGEYCHLGINSGLQNIFSVKYCLNNTIDLSFNFDGIPLFTSNNIQIWPISCLLKNVKSKPFIVGIFCGNAKPKPLDKYLDDFVNELSDLLQNGFNFNNRIYLIKIHSIICDAPARAYIKCIKSHGGYHACDKCTENGEFHGRVIYLSTNAKLRTDTSFLFQEDKEHHMGNSPLLKLNIGMVSTCPIDYMHNVCLGVMRKILCIWIGITRNTNIRVRLRSRLINMMSDHLISLKPFIPVEFNRKPRSLNELQRWKATELRTFLLYLGPLILKDVLDLAVYEHFALLNCAITILLSEKYILQFGLDFTRNLLNLFVNHSKKIYGVEFLVYNVHALCHLPDDVQKYGPLNVFSAFPFENYFAEIKALVRSAHKPLQQICNRLHETSLLGVQITEEMSLIHFMEHIEGPLLHRVPVYKQYKKISFKDCMFSISNYSLSDSYFLTKENKVIRIDNITLNSENTTLLLGKEFQFYDTFYNYPIDSKLLNIYILDQLSINLEVWPIDSIMAKVILLPFKNKWVCFPIIHSNA